MTAANTFKILDGQFGLAVIDTAAVGYASTWLAPAGKDVADVLIADYIAASIAWSCQLTEFRLTASASTRTETIEDTICEAGQEVPIPLKSTWRLAGNMYQDLHVATGLQQFAHDHDAAEVYAFCAFDGVNPPKAICRVFMSPVADTGGVARTSLKTAFDWAVNGTPQILYGNATASAAVPEEEVVVMAAASGGGKK